MKHPLWNELPRWLLTWLLCFALALGLGALLRLDSRWWLAASVLLLWSAVLAAAEHFGRFRAMLALWIAALGLCLLVSDRKMLVEAASAIVSGIEAENGYGEFILLLVCSSAVLPLSVLLRRYWFRAALSLGCIVLWIAAALLEWPLPRPLPAALLPLLLLTLTETVRRLRREPEPDKPLTRALLLSLLPTLLLALLPAPSAPYGYPLLHSIAETVEQLWEDMETARNYRHEGVREFGLSFNGLSETAEVGEGAGEDSAGAVYAKPDRTPDGALYLFGNALDRFDGRSWTSSLMPEDEKTLSWSMDTAEHLYALWRLPGAADGSTEVSDYFRENNVYVNCRNMDMRTLFTVMNATRIFTDEKRFPYADTPTGSLFDYVQREDVWYRVYFLEANARTLSALIAASEGTRYDIYAHGPRWYQLTQVIPAGLYLNLQPNMNMEKAFAERAAMIRSIYLDSSEVSERAAALAKEITSGCAGDAERVAAIAAYLQGNYSYTLHPAPVPKGESFLDWLLFEGREGYCTWYATAAVLLARSVGVPARYVQGYLSELTGGEFTKLEPRDAHAWCECYIAGYGWMTMEATPGFGGVGEGWLTAAEERAVRGGGAGTAEEAAEEPHPDGAAERDGESPALPDTTGRGDRDREPASEPDAGPAPSGWPAALISAGLLAALAAVWLWLRARRKRRYAEADPAMRLQMDLETLLRDLRGRGYPRQPEESLRQYFARLPWRNLLVREDEAEEMAALYDRTFFAMATPSEAELEQHRTFAARFRPRTLRQWMIWHRMQPEQERERLP